MAQRISRAKRTLRSRGRAFEMPPAERARGPASRVVLAVLYLLFNEGYAASTGRDLTRPTAARRRSGSPGSPTGCCRTTPRSTRPARPHAPPRRAAPGARTASGDARAARRAGPLLWDRRLVAEGDRPARLDAAAGRPPDAYQVQAAIAAVHDRAPHGRRHRLAAGARALRAARAGGAAARSSRWPGRWRWPRPRARRPRARCSRLSSRRLGGHQRLARREGPRRRAGRRPGGRAAALPGRRGPGDEPRRAAPPHPPGGRSRVSPATRTATRGRALSHLLAARRRGWEAGPMTLRRANLARIDGGSLRRAHRGRRHQRRRGRRVARRAGRVGGPGRPRRLRRRSPARSPRNLVWGGFKYLEHYELRWSASCAGRATG